MRRTPPMSRYTNYLKHIRVYQKDSLDLHKTKPHTRAALSREEYRRASLENMLHELLLEQ